ncbi:DNA-binding protein [Clostridia bacterium]|nr:DNA-binding protein [Clostridia bacterium]
MDYISTKEASEKWEISERRIQKLCEENRIPGVVRFSRVWAIPKDADKPIDGRKKDGKDIAEKRQ